MTGKTYICPGCRQTLVIASPDGEELIETCPVEDCRRVIWCRQAGFDHLTICVPHAPDLSSGRFVIDQYRLLDDGTELISGPTHVLEPLCAMLNDIDPSDRELIKLVRYFIQQHGAGCVFTPGYALITAGRRAMESEGK